MIKKIIGIIIVIILAFWFLIQPSNERDWTVDQQVLSYADIQENLITLHNIRNFTYVTTEEYTPQYYDKTVDLNKIKALYYIVEPFGEWSGAAHTFLSFEFEDNEFIAISIEIRKEKGESFSALKGVFKRYELMYVIGDEQDLVKLRAVYRNDTVYVYPIETRKEKIQALFLNMMERTNKLKEKPEFYNTIKNTCTTNLMKHVNTISPDRLPFTWKVLAPGYSDEVVYKLGLIKTNLSFEETREKYKINEKAQKYKDDPDFSTKIREERENSAEVDFSTKRKEETKNDLGGFCGRSTYGSCKTNNDCETGGCSGQVCQSKKEERMATTCEWRECYDDEAYNIRCGCREGQCQWSK